jgi:hypothetical protein
MAEMKTETLKSRKASTRYPPAALDANCTETKATPQITAMTTGLSPFSARFPNKKKPTEQIGTPSISRRRNSGSKTPLFRLLMALHSRSESAPQMKQPMTPPMIGPPVIYPISAVPIRYGGGENIWTIVKLITTFQSWEKAIIKIAQRMTGFTSTKNGRPCREVNHQCTLLTKVSFFEEASL